MNCEKIFHNRKWMNVVQGQTLPYTVGCDDVSDNVPSELRDLLVRVRDLVSGC